MALRRFVTFSASSGKPKREVDVETEDEEKEEEEDEGTRRVGIIDFKIALRRRYMQLANSDLVPRVPSSTISTGLVRRGDMRCGMRVHRS